MLIGLTPGVHTFPTCKTAVAAVNGAGEDLVFVGSVDNLGHATVVSRNMATGEQVYFKLADVIDVKDDHNMACPLVIKNGTHAGKILCSYAAHGTQNQFYTRRSTNVLDVSAFDAEVTVPGQNPAGTVTYPTLFELPTHGTLGDRIVCFYRNNSVNLQWSYVVSYDGGGTWDTANDAVLLASASGSTGVYPTFAQTGNVFDCWASHRDREDLLFISFDFSGATPIFRRADGTPAGSAGGTLPPTIDSEYDVLFKTGLRYEPTSAWRGSDSDRRVTYTQFTTQNAEVRHFYARWNGTAWTHTEIDPTKVGGHFDSTGNQKYPPENCLVFANPNRVFVGHGSATGTDILEYLTADNGATFTLVKTHVTALGDSVVHFRPQQVWDAPEYIRCVLNAGTYPDYLTYQTARMLLVESPGVAGPYVSGFQRRLKYTANALTGSSVSATRPSSDVTCAIGARDLPVGVLADIVDGNDVRVTLDEAGAIGVACRVLEKTADRFLLLMAMSGDAVGHPQLDIYLWYKKTGATPPPSTKVFRDDVLAAYWFGEPSGFPQDISGKGKHATAIVAASRASLSFLGASCLELRSTNAPSEYVDISPPPLTSFLTRHAIEHVCQILAGAEGGHIPWSLTKIGSDTGRLYPVLSEAGDTWNLTYAVTNVAVPAVLNDLTPFLSSSLAFPAGNGVNIACNESDINYGAVTYTPQTWDNMRINGRNDAAPDNLGQIAHQFLVVQGDHSITSYDRHRLLYESWVLGTRWTPGTPVALGGPPPPGRRVPPALLMALAS